MFSFTESIIDKCNPPCQNGGTCYTGQNLFKSNTVSTRCFCTEAYYGNTCQHNRGFCNINIFLILIRIWKYFSLEIEYSTIFLILYIQKLKRLKAIKINVEKVTYTPFYCRSSWEESQKSSRDKPGSASNPHKLPPPSMTVQNIQSVTVA